MSEPQDELQDIETRLTAALARIESGLAAQGERAAEGEAAAEHSARLEAQLEEERVANAQLEERVKSLKDRQEGRIARLEAQIGEERERAARLDDEMQALRQSNAELSELTEALRRAMLDELPDEALVNRAVLAELEALKAQHDADRAEVEEILGTLRPMLEPQEKEAS